jgi:hypothetical protein
LGPIAENQGWTHRLGEQEALVVLGELPPPGRYFGFQPYIFSREGQLDEADVLFQSLTDPFMKSILFMKSPNPSRPLVFSSIGDSINNVVIEHQSGAAFGEQRFFIMTPDAGLEKEMRQVLLQSGVPDTRHIFKAPIPASFAKLGLNSSADDFMTVLRYALPEDEIAGDQWRQQLPLVVFRVRSHERNQIATPYSVSVRETRSVRSELNLQHSLDKLVVGLKNRWAQMNSVSSEFRSLLLAMDLLGEHCIKRPMNCLGDTADADYQISETASVDQDEILAVAGTLGTVTGNATYTSLAVNRIPELIGVSNLTDKDLKGTASDLFPGSQDSEKLYLVYFARDCGNMKHCHPITEAMVPHGDQLKFIQRNYVVPGTTRGPAPGGLVNPKMIVLKKMH